MKLLTPEATEKVKLGEEKSREQNIQKLYDLETDLVRRVNEARENAEKEMKQISEDLEAYRNEKAEEKSLLSKLMDWARGEVEKLEDRRKEAMTPIEELRKEADDRLAEIGQKEARLDQRASELTERENMLLERTQSLVEREEKLGEREDGLEKREVKVASEEESSAQSARELGDKWVGYHQAVNEMNAETARKEKHFQDGVKANETFHLTLVEEQARLKAEDVRIKDAYGAIEQAKIHLGIK